MLWLGKYNSLIVTQSKSRWHWKYLFNQPVPATKIHCKFNGGSNTSIKIDYEWLHNEALLCSRSLLSHTPATKRFAARQAGTGTGALPTAGTTAARLRTLSCGPWSQVRPCQLVVPTTEKQNGPWRPAVARPRTHPSSLPIARGAAVTGRLEVSNAEGSKHPWVSQILLPFPWRVGTRLTS